MKDSVLPSRAHSLGDSIHGFMVEAVDDLDDIRSVAYLLNHEKSGARLLHLHSNDEENLFAIALRTPPPDHSGLPHILEHTVLCGSKRFPVKDPFLELIKTSLATFINAMTYPDKTVYPVASMNRKDFRNLATVYCDSVFHPLLREEHFKQEGHHFDFAEPGNTDSQLVIKGIVYNEMKGAYSDLDGCIWREQTKSICPDNAYGFDSGGDPEFIPSLTYEQFKAFHRTYYHPSNALIFIYGNIPTEEHLEFLERDYLSNFDRIDVDTSIVAQPRWDEPLEMTLPYPIGANEDTEGKTAVVITYLTNDVTEAIRSLSMNVLDYYLLGNAASPLRKALIDSKLGEELTDAGYDDSQRDTLFTVGLKGTEARRADAIVELVNTTCAELVKSGLEKEKVEAAFHRLELSSKEISSMYPLRLMDQVYSSWLYEGDPNYHLRLKEHLQDLRCRYETEEGFFEKQLKEMIVENPHYTVLTFTPDKEYVARKEEKSQKTLEEVRKGMSRELLETIAKEAAELDAMQSAPNTPEALATLPRLALSDVPPNSVELDTTELEVAGRPLLYTDVFSNGLNYLSLAFDLSGLDDVLIDYLPLFTSAMTKMGAGDDDYVVMAEREAASTGGVGAGASAGGHVLDPHRVQPFLKISSCALDAKFPEMLAILEDRILHFDLTDLERLKDIVRQRRVHLHSGIVSSGTQYASLHAKRKMSRNREISERLGGFTQIRFFDDLAGGLDDRQDQIVEKLAAIRDFIQANGRLTGSFVGGEAQLTQLQEWFGGFAGSLRDETPPRESIDYTPDLSAVEGVATPADVAFVAEVFPAVGATHPDAAVLTVLCHSLGLDYLFGEVRIKGGAYGANSSYSPIDGTISFGSYRDPNIKATLDVYHRIPDYIANQMDLSQDTMEQSIIGSIKRLDSPIRPSSAVGTAFSRFLTGSTREHRKQFRTRLLSVTGDDIRRVASELIEPGFTNAPVCVLSSREKLESANDEMEGALEISDLVSA